MNRRDRWAQRVVIVGMLGILVLALAVPLGAQTDLTDGAGPEPPLRDGEGVAPERGPVILVRENLPDGSIHVIMELPATADTYIASNRPTQNFGNDALFLGYNLAGDNYGAERILLQFDVEGFLPDNIIVNSAQLRLHLIFSSPPEDDPMGTVLRRVASPWSEYGVTWELEPTWGEIRTSADVGSVEGEFYGWDVTGLVTDWLDGDSTNYGMEIIGDERIQQRERAFTQREAATDFPRLRVDYTVVEDDLPPIVTVDPLPEFSRRNFTVSWSGEDQGSAGIAYYDVQYRLGEGTWLDWKMGVVLTSAEFMNGENGRLYQFRARGVDEFGNVELFEGPEAETEVDTVPPEATMDPLPPIIHETTFALSWTGTDDGGSGIQYYDVRMRFNGGDWRIILSQTTQTSVLFEATDGDGVYEFEVRAVDHLDQAEPFRGAEVSTAVDVVMPFVESVVWLPLAVEEVGAGR